MAQFLCLAYPCSVDGGVDPVEFVKQILQRQNAQQLRKAVCRILGVPESTSNPSLYRKAESLRKKWRVTVAKDETNMASDFQSAEHLLAGKQLTRHPSSQVINGLDNEQITNLKAFLRYYNTMFHQGIRILYLIGHAISSSGATILQQNPADDTCRSEVWPWPLNNYLNLKESLQQVTDDAQKGDLVVFSSGLLTPEWVIGVLQEAESKAQNQFPNIIVIVVDACYSGTWVERMRAELERMRAQLGNDPLKYTRILLQTSCGPDEESYGQLFTPQFVNLNLLPNYEINVRLALPTQNPQFFDSKDPSPQSQQIPIISINIESRNFKFINTPIGDMGPENHVQSRNDAFCTKVPYN